MNWIYEGDFLKQFNDWERNMATQMVCRAYRGLPSVYVTAPETDKAPAEHLTQMLERLEKEVMDRSANKWNSPELAALLTKLSEQIETDSLKEFCRFIVKRERANPEEKQAAKNDAQKVYVQKAMSKKPPSVKQLALLKKLGVMTVPGTMAEASVLIDAAMKH